MGEVREISREITKEEEWKIGLNEARTEREKLSKKLINIYYAKAEHTVLDLAMGYLRLGKKGKAEEELEDYYDTIAIKGVADPEKKAIKESNRLGKIVAGEKIHPKIDAEKLKEEFKDIVDNIKRANFDLAGLYIRMGKEEKALDIITESARSSLVPREFEEITEEADIIYERMEKEIKSRTKTLLGLKKRRTEMNDEEAFKKFREGIQYYKKRFKKTKDLEDIKNAIGSADEVEDIYLFLTVKKSK